ncbi:WD40 domain-containing protein, partial [Oryctes borbonicus]
GIYPMPDEKVISGCFWGNFLVWEAGLIKLEVFRKLRKKCHEGPIVQFDFKDGELWTVAMDGRIRVWHYDTIDQADPPDDDRVVQLEPIYDFYTPNVEFMCISKRSSNPKDTFYYAQDGNGGLWKIDLTTELNVSPSVQLYECHAGRVVDIAVCPWGPYLVSLGEDGRIYLYNYITREKLLKYQFPAKGVCMLWLPLNVDTSGNILILGFDDGNLRVIVLDISEWNESYNITLLQKTKPHHKPLTYMSLNPSGSILVTSGEDKTIFVFKIKKENLDYISLVPIGLVGTTDIVTYITWHRENDDTVILGCLHGFIE